MVEGGGGWGLLFVFAPWTRSDIVCFLSNSGREGGGGSGMDGGMGVAVSKEIKEQGIPANVF